MINDISHIESSNNFNKNLFMNTKPNFNDISSFCKDNQSPYTKENIPPHRTEFPAKIGLFSPSSDTISPIFDVEVLQISKDPDKTVDFVFYPSGALHYVKYSYNGVITKQIEYTSNGIVITIDEYTDGVLMRHTDNYPATGKPWVIEEYSEKGEILRYYKYKPDGKLYEYQAFPVEE